MQIVSINVRYGIINKIECPGEKCDEILILPDNLERKVQMDCPKCNTHIILSRSYSVLDERLHQKKMKDREKLGK
jgi:uncharacterized paraquat-inducible protein A